MALLSFTEKPGQISDWCHGAQTANLRRRALRSLVGHRHRAPQRTFDESLAFAVRSSAIVSATRPTSFRPPFRTGAWASPLWTSREQGIGRGAVIIVIGVTGRFVQYCTSSRKLNEISGFQIRSFAHGYTVGRISANFCFQNPLSKPSSKAIGIWKGSVRGVFLLTVRF